MLYFKLAVYSLTSPCSIWHFDKGQDDLLLVIIKVLRRCKFSRTISKSSPWFPQLYELVHCLHI